jgi:Ca2+-transporting ATPase
VICSDKTGTLTRNEMTVREIWTPTGQFCITGSGYMAEGEFLRVATNDHAAEPANGQPVDPAAEPDLLSALTIGAACNNARAERRGDDSWQVLGDPTEGALIVAAMKARIDVAHFERLHEIPFNSDRKAMSVIVRDAQGLAAMYTKGAVEVLLERCTLLQQGGHKVPLSSEMADTIRCASAQMGERALRVLALARRPVSETKPLDAEETNLIFVGLMGMIDPPRDEAADAIEVCRSAGIRPVMITGDHPTTALAVARELKLPGIENGVVVGVDLDEASEGELTTRVERTTVYARVAPKHKLQIVRALQSRGHVAAMTGDGVNDAPAVKAADIGVSMGRTGTDVTRSASDMVLMDDNFASIVAAVEEGRCIFDNIQKVTHYLLSCNMGELICLFFAALVGWPAPLSAIQILWINLITDGVPALALGVEPPDRDIMQRPPRHPRESLISGSDALSTVAHGFLIAIVATAGFAWVYAGQGASLEEARAVAFSIMAFSQLFFAVGCRSRRYTMPEIGWFTNPALFWAIAASVMFQFSVMSLPATRALFKTGILDISGWALVLSLSLAPVSLIETAKLIRAVVFGRLARSNASSACGSFS